MASSTASTNPHPWSKDLKTLVDAYAPQQPTIYLVERLISLPSLNIIYGAPGCLKSFLLADMICCLAAGKHWLEPAPWELKQILPFVTHKIKSLWIDFDNGLRRTTNRFAALGKFHQLPDNAPINFVSMPVAGFDASKTKDISELIDLIRVLDVGIVTIDNLLTISGDIDENSPVIGKIMTQLRFVSEKTGSVINLLHHSRKVSVVKGKMGDDLRGHSSIRGSIDLALYVEREPNTAIVTITSTKSRDIEVQPFGATFTYSHKAGTNDLEDAAFYGVSVAGLVTDLDIEQAVIDVLSKLGPSSGGLTQNSLVTEVRKSIKAGINRVRDIVNKMVHTGKIKTTPGGRGAVYHHL